jgi:hypothetical protein
MKVTSQSAGCIMKNNKPQRVIPTYSNNPDEKRQVAVAKSGTLTIDSTTRKTIIPVKAKGVNAFLCNGEIIPKKMRVEVLRAHANNIVHIN